MRLQILSASLTLRPISRLTGIMAKSPTVQHSVMANSPLKLLNATNFRYEESPYPTISLRIPGLTHESFDRNGNPKATSVMLTTTTARAYSFHTLLPPSDKGLPKTGERYFLDWPRLTHEFFAFASASEFIMSRALYEKSVRKWPLDMKFTLGHVGSCSVASTSKFYVCNGEAEASPGATPLWSNTTQFVTVDKTTRKPARLPDWYQSQFKGKGYMDKGLVVRPFDRPALTYAHPFTVQWTDTDFYKHTNWATYVRWAIDALHAALLLQNTSTARSDSPYSREAATGGDSAKDRARAALHGITSDMVASGLRKMHIVYLKECLQGDYIETHVWQENNGEKDLVYFSIVKDGEDICQIKMWYFDSLHEEEEDDEYPV